MRERRALVRRRRCISVLAVALVLVAAPTHAASADDVSAAELRRRVERALADPAAVAEVRSIDSVDGRRVHLERALAGASGANLQARLRALEPGAETEAVTDAGGDPSAEASRILDQRRFHPGAVPRPFRGLFRTLGRWLEPITGPLGRLWSDIYEDGFVVAILAAAVVGLAAMGSVRIIRRRSAAGVVRVGRAGRLGSHDDPDDLERRAAEAERAGDLALALRLRFRAGLARLDRAGVVADRPALTTGGLLRQLPSEELHGLAEAFEEVAYGGRPASVDDLAAARMGWPRVLDEVAR